jgi:hypothetical protein
MDIKEIMLKIADSLRNKIDGISHMQSNQGLVGFAEALIAELAKQNEPVAWWNGKETAFFEHETDGPVGEVRIPLYALPPTAPQIEQRVAEACALQVATETRFHWLDATRVAKEIRSGEWKRYLK